MSTDRPVIISIHDVAPSTMDEVRYLLERLDSIGAKPRVLKVIPNEDGCHDIRADSAFLRLLADEAAAGSEIVLHGYTHRVAGPMRGPGMAHLRARLFAGTAAEFLSLDAAQMVERLSLGRQMVQSVGCEPRGFCAPGWLAPPELPRLLRQCGFHYYVTMLSVVDLTTGRRLWTPWLGYMGAGAMQEELIRLGGAVILALSECMALPVRLAASAVHLLARRPSDAQAASVPTVKVFFHPQGARDSAACAYVIQMLARLLRTRRPVTYGGLLAC